MFNFTKAVNYCDLRIKIERKRIVPSKYVNYLGVLIDSSQLVVSSNLPQNYPGL